MRRIARRINFGVITSKTWLWLGLTLLVCAPWFALGWRTQTQASTTGLKAIQAERSVHFLRSAINARAPKLATEPVPSHLHGLQGKLAALESLYGFDGVHLQTVDISLDRASLRMKADRHERALEMIEHLNAGDAGDAGARWRLERTQELPAMGAWEFSVTCCAVKHGV